ncbi:MAG: hypothetical protein JSR77_17455 [Planctomycetes bacterium]|nr:hypothetical protein [Planctomycetota bacterium]
MKRATSRTTKRITATRPAVRTQATRRTLNPVMGTTRLTSWASARAAKATSPLKATARKNTRTATGQSRRVMRKAA